MGTLCSIALGAIIVLTITKISDWRYDKRKKGE